MGVCENPRVKVMPRYTGGTTFHEVDRETGERATSLTPPSYSGIGVDVDITCEQTLTSFDESSERSSSLVMQNGQFIYQQSSSSTGSLFSLFFVYGVGSSQDSLGTTINMQREGFGPPNNGQDRFGLSNYAITAGFGLGTQQHNLRVLGSVSAATIAGRAVFTHDGPDSTLTHDLMPVDGPFSLFALKLEARFFKYGTVGLAFQFPSRITDDGSPSLLETSDSHLEADIGVAAGLGLSLPIK